MAESTEKREREVEIKVGDRKSGESRGRGLYIKDYNRHQHVPASVLGLDYFLSQWALGGLPVEPGGNRVSQV